MSEATPLPITVPTSAVKLHESTRDTTIVDVDAMIHSDSGDWCDGSVGSIVSIGDSSLGCYSMSSDETVIDMEFLDCDCIQNLVPVKIEPTLLRRHRSASREGGIRSHQQAWTCSNKDLATVVSSTSCISRRIQPTLLRDDAEDDFYLRFNQAITLPSQILYDDSNLSPRQKPFDILPDEVVCRMFGFLNVESLCSARCISKRLGRLASQDEAGWLDICVSTWQKKAHVCWRAIQLKESHGAMIAYKESCHDGRHRHEITPTELCFDPISGSGTVWYFRFKETAGPAWTSLDPWYAGLGARKMVFLRDGTVCQLLPNLTGSEDASKPNDSFLLEPAIFDALDQTTTQSRIEMKWRFVLEPMDLPTRTRGAYIRLHVGGRDVPTYSVRRSPTDNWGFVMENCWGVFASFPLPRQQPFRRPARIRLRRTSEGIGRWFNVNELESDSEEDVADDTLQHIGEDGNICSCNLHADASLLDDSSLTITNRQQWREALLYNYGAVSLPEGDNAVSEFDRIFQSLRLPREPSNMQTF